MCSVSAHLVQIFGERAAELVAACADQVDARLVRVAVLAQHLATEEGGEIVEEGRCQGNRGVGESSGGRRTREVVE